MITAEIRSKRSISRKNLVLPIEKFPCLLLPRNAINMSERSNKWSLTGDEKQNKFQIISSKIGRDRLREVVAYKRFHM